MQDRYLGDIGDFAKFGLLRGLNVADASLRLGILWYRVPDNSDTNDGRYIDYLQPTIENHSRFRVCDPELYDKLGALVRARKRGLPAVPASGLLPSDTIYHDQPLSYRGVLPRDRRVYRQRWMVTAHQLMAPAEVIFADPDNGLEVGVDRHDNKGPKYTFYVDLVPLSRAGKSIVIYQHADRNGPFCAQISGRIAALQTALARPSVTFMAIRWRRRSARAFIFVLGSDHRQVIQKHLQTFLAGPWGQHFEQISLTEE